MDRQTVYMISINTKVYSQNEKEVGHTTGSRRQCQLSGCLGVGIYVRWADGKLTIPCSKGLVTGPEKHSLKIG